MPSTTVYRTSAFTDASEGGNEAGVVLDAAGLDDKTMQSLAEAVGYSETAFIRKIVAQAIHVRYFTPTSEVPLCGHASIALLNLLRHLGHLEPGSYTLHTIAGTHPVKITDDEATLIFKEPQITATHKPQTIARLLGLQDHSLDQTLPIATIDAGVRELYIGLPDKKNLKNLELDRGSLLEASDRLKVAGVVFYVANVQDALAEVRNFLPTIGIEEESATGTAAAGLSRLLHTYKRPFRKGIIRQGESLGKPSRISVTILEDDSTTRTIGISGKFRVIDSVDVTL